MYTVLFVCTRSVSLSCFCVANLCVHCPVSVYQICITVLFLCVSVSSFCKTIPFGVGGGGGGGVKDGDFPALKVTAVSHDDTGSRIFAANYCN